MTGSRKMAYWTEEEHLFSGTKYVCSNCGCETDRPYSSCPECGADMSGRQKYDPKFVDECEIMDILDGGW